MKTFLFARFIFAIAVIANTAICKAAEIEVDSSPAGDRFIAIRGAIRSGDAIRLKRALSRAPNDNSPLYTVVSIRVNSPGGDVREAIAMASVISRILAPVSVEGDGLCASACFFVWLGGVPHNASSPAQITYWKNKIEKQLGLPNPFGVIGLHRPYLTDIQSPINDQGKVMKLVREYLDEQLVSRRLIDTMLSRPSNDIYWLTEADLSELGEYPPDVEEYLIKKCGYRRNDTATGLETINRVANCQLSSLSELRKSRQAELGR